MRNLLRSPFLWIGAVTLSGMLYFFAFHFFPQTFPLVHADITMDLEQAIEQADIIAQKNNFGPEHYQSAAMFHTDNTVKTFVELEAGGTSTFVAMMEEKLYMPYTWKIRHFKEHEKNETTITFTPDGKPYGFIETISENVPGAQLSENDARTLAEKEAITNWNINFSFYTLVEASQKTEISNRVDHTFVYERTDSKIGEGQYRLKIVVSGNKTTELTHFVKVPESFTRRYAEMRSANTTIAMIASLIVLFLYFIGGGCYGLYWIIKKRWHLFKQPLLWGFILASTSVLVSINQLPFLWMQYNSAFSINNFLVKLFLSLFVSLFAQTTVYTTIITAAESLTRRAFGKHPQLWSIFSSENSSSYAILSRTLGGYLLVGFNMAFVIAFYLLSIRYLGWWSPSEMLFDPNILATYAPWFSPLATALNAGFIEECLFRAIPLAGAALLGTYFGKRNWWIGAAFILQAIIFGAAHANYPVQPSYGRLVELLIPSFIWGATYLMFGLLPTIIAHVVYDVIWMSLPIFVSNAPDAFTYKIIICTVTLFPLLRITYARFRKGTWTDLPESAKNATWQPLQVPQETQESTVIEQTVYANNLHYRKTTFALGILGLIAWICTTQFTHDGVTITLDRNQAVARANNFLEQKHISLTAPWQTLPLIFTHYQLVPHIATQHKFIWKKGKKELYHSLLGTYLQPAHWTIRYAQFDGDLIQRAEEHKIMLYDDTIWRHYHQLPESSAGASLHQAQARAIAHTTLQEQFNIDPTQVTEISATQGQLPNRTNWLFIFSNPTVYPLQTGQARISILIGGDTVIDAARTIHVPEEWERKEQNKQNTLSIVVIIFSIVLMSSLLFGIIILFRQKHIFPFSKSLFFILLGISAIISIVDIINTWPSIAGVFNTSLPLRDQLLQFILSLGLSSLLKSIFYALLISYVLSYKTKHKLLHNWFSVGTGICTGLFFAGIIAYARTLIPHNMPLWPTYDALGCSIPLLASLLSSIIYCLQITTLLSLLFMLIDTATIQWQKHRILFTIIAALIGMAIVGLPSLKMLPLWILVGTTIGFVFIALYQHIIRYNYALIPLATGSVLILHLVQQGIFNAYPGATLAAMINILATLIVSALWYWYILKTNK